MAATSDEVFQKVRAALIDALGVEEEEVTPSATMVGDLGAESIDFLDIMFKLEQSFGINIPRSELFPDDILNNPSYVQDGKVTSTGIAELKKRMPYLDLSKFESHPVVQNFVEMLTVSDLCKFIESKLAEKSAGA